MSEPTPVEDRPEVQEAIAEDTGTSELPGTGSAEGAAADPATPLFQEPGEAPQ